MGRKMESAMLGRSQDGSNGHNASEDLLDVTELVRSLQRQENAPDCFKKSGGACAQEACFWREWCLKIG